MQDYIYLWHAYVDIFLIRFGRLKLFLSIREAAKKVPLLVAMPLRDRGRGETAGLHCLLSGPGSERKLPTNTDVE